MNDDFYMGMAIEEARKALRNGEIPVGAIVTLNDAIVGRGHNDRRKNNSPFGHAEIIAISEASEKLGNWRFDDCTLYVTLEPCVMCAGAIMQCRFKKLIFGAYDPKAGACGSLYDVVSDSRMCHKCISIGGIRKSECADLISKYFFEKRSIRKTTSR